MIISTAIPFPPLYPGVRVVGFGVSPRLTRVFDCALRQPTTSSQIFTAREAIIAALPVVRAYCSSGANARCRGRNPGCAAASKGGGVVGGTGVMHAACGIGRALVARTDRAHRQVRRAPAGPFVLRGSVAGKGPAAFHVVAANGRRGLRGQPRACHACAHRYAVDSLRAATATFRRVQDARAAFAAAGARASVRRAGLASRLRLASGRRGVGGHAALAR